MGKRLVLVCLCLSAVLAVCTASGADSGLRILESRHTARFGEKMSFRLVAEHDQAIVGVTLYYRYRGSEQPVTNRVVPAFTPGRHVEAGFEKTLERGEIPPGTAIEYYWRLELADGTRLDTETQTFAYEDDRFAWRTLEDGHVVLLYYGPSAQDSLAQDLLQRSQKTLARLQSEVGVELGQPVRIYLYRSRQDMAGALSPRSQGFDERVVTLGVAAADDTLLLLASHPDVGETLAHELSHLVVGLATQNPYAPLPRWLDEGLAMFAQGELPAHNARALKEAIRRDALLSVRSLSGYTGDASQVDLYYGEVHSLVQFLTDTYDRDKMAELLQVFKQGAYQEDALRQVYGLDLDGLDARWRQSLGLQPRPSPAPSTGAPPRREQASRPLCPLSSLAGGLALALALAVRSARGPSGPPQES